MQTEREFLLQTGMINRSVFAGIQPDDCVVWRKVEGGGFQNASLCNHDCLVTLYGKPTGGNYACDASFSSNLGARARFAPREAIVRWTLNVARAHAVARDMFFANHFDRYCEEFQISPSWAEAIRSELTAGDKMVEVNHFGGSPEMLPDCADIVADCKAANLVVNLTTPGRRFMLDNKFAADIVADSPHMLALSFDDVGRDELVRLAGMDLDGLKAEWKKVSPHHGQKQKAYEGFYAARLMRERGIPVTILFNMVIHPGNIKHFESLMEVLSECIPGCFANPYPAQAFEGKPPCWTLDSLPFLRAHIVSFTERMLQKTQGITRRLHYYVVLEAVFRKWRRCDPERLIEFMSGQRAWDCTKRPGAYRYVQVGRNREVVNTLFDKLPIPGGHIGCFWNPHWALREQVNGNAEQLAEFMLTGVVELGKRLFDVPKTSIMPRLMFDMVSTELGLPEELVPEYLATRREYAGF